MTTPVPAQIKMALEAKAMELAVRVVGVHSVYLLDDDVVDAIFDISPDVCGNGLHFQFPLPQLVSRNDLLQFSLWLACPGHVGETMH